MSTRDASLKESNYEDAYKFDPERWLKNEENAYHLFASVPFGFGPRKCLGQSISETLLTVLTMKVKKSLFCIKNLNFLFTHYTTMILNFKYQYRKFQMALNFI